MSLSWDIVFWLNEDATDFVPSSWANTSKTKYKFPIGPRMTEAKKRKLIYTCASLNKGEYTWYNAKCKKTGITDIPKAKVLCEMSKATSNLESAEETLPSDTDSGDDMAVGFKADNAKAPNKDGDELYERLFFGKISKSTYLLIYLI